MGGQMGQLAVQAVVAAGAHPVRRVVALAGAQIELHRQLQMVHAVLVAQQQVQLAERASAQADRQVAGQQLDAGCRLQGKLPESLVVEAQAADRAVGQPAEQGGGLLVEAAQPVGQPSRLTRPAAAGQRMALRPFGIRQQRRRQQGPGQIADLGLPQRGQQIGKREEGMHAVEHSGRPVVHARFFPGAAPGRRFRP